MQVVVCLLALLSILWISDGANLTGIGKQNAQYKIHVTKLVCLEQPYKLITLHACKVRLRRNQPTLILLEMDFPVLLDQIFLEFQMNYKLTTYQPMMMAFSIEVCKFFGQPEGTEPVADYIKAGVKVYIPQLVHPCPYGNRYYNATFLLDERYVPKAMPAGDYRLDARAWDKNNVTIMSIQLYGSIRSKGIASLSLMDW